MSHSVINREVGQYPLSIATSLAIESLTNIHPDQNWTNKPITEYGCLYVNIKTMFRNMVGALGGDPTPIESEELASELSREMDTIKSIAVDEGVLPENVVFYLNNYIGLEVRYPKATPRAYTTPKQKNYALVQNKTITILLKSLKESHLAANLKIYTLHVTNENKEKTIILTHAPFDLLKYDSFNSLTLVESHTGKIKERALWYTKYYGKDIPVMPWNAGLLQIFGDSETFRPMSFKLKKEVIELAKEYKWTAATTKDKLRMCVTHVQNPYAREILRSLI